MMLSVHGCVILKDPEVKEFKNDRYTYFYCNLVSVDGRGNDHSYRAKIVTFNDEEAEKARSKLVSGAVFFIRYGEWSMYIKEGRKYPNPLLSIKFRDLQKFNPRVFEEAYE